MSGAGVLVWGEALADLIPEDAGATRYEAALGGSGFNTALSLARCGAATMLAARLSKDALGRGFARRLREEGIASPWPDSEAPTPLALVEPLAGDGQADYRFHLAGTALDAPPPGDTPLAFAHLHLTSFAATVGASGAGALALARQAHAAGASLSYDLNIRPPALPEREATLALVRERASLCGLVKLSAEDAGWLAGSVAESLAMFDGSLVLVTDGARGATLHGLADGPVSAVPPEVIVTDTIGAGDALMGGFLAALSAEGALGGPLRGVPRETACCALAFAVRVAALTCTMRGCDPPRLVPERTE